MQTPVAFAFSQPQALLRNPAASPDSLGSHEESRPATLKSKTSVVIAAASTVAGARFQRSRRRAARVALRASDCGVGGHTSTRREPQIAASAVETATATMTRDAPCATPVRSGRGVRDAPCAAPASSAPSWRERFWFPVASVKELDPMRPTPVRIDGLDLVVWKIPVDAAGEEQWRCFSDMCPHRLAPLSEGRIEPKTGNLQCAYHGWEFNGDGACERIPQVDEESSVKMRQNQKSCTVAFPLELAMNVLWVWLGEGPPKGSPKDLVRNTALEDEEFYSTYTRDLPYGFDALVENLLDVSHIPFAHHGLQGTRDDAAPITMTMAEVDKDDEDGNLINFDFTDRTMKMSREASLVLRSPFFFFYDGKMFPEESADKNEVDNFSARRGLESAVDAEFRPFRLNVICVPVAPGMSRLILVNARKPGTESLFSKFPAWIVHLLSNKFLDSDLAFLHYQERTLRRDTLGGEPRSADKWQTGYFMPAESDKSVGAWRRWLATEGARCVECGFAEHLPASPLRRDQILDRFTQHTAHCVQCRGALDDFDVWQRALGVTGVGSLILDRLSIGPTPVWLAAEIFAIIAVVGLERVKKEFHFVDYEHYKS